MEIKEYQSKDCLEMFKLFYDTVHTINAQDYSKVQLEAWANHSIDLEKWNESFLKNHTLVAWNDNQIVGFGDISNEGYLDFLYVHKDYQEQGIASALCNELEKKVKGKIITHASITAKPFFEHRGYRIITSQRVERKGILLVNYIMQKEVE